jgi:hypothetical protein
VNEHYNRRGFDTTIRAYSTARQAQHFEKEILKPPSGGVLTVARPLMAGAGYQFVNPFHDFTTRQIQTPCFSPQITAKHRKKVL